MTRRHLTMAIILVVVVGLILYDIYAAFVPGATISEVTLHLAHKHPIIPFALGVLCGHFFWSQSAEAQYHQAWRVVPEDAGFRWVPLGVGLAVLGLGMTLAALTLARGG